MVYQVFIHEEKTITPITIVVLKSLWFLFFSLFQKLASKPLSERILQLNVVFWQVILHGKHGWNNIFASLGYIMRVISERL